MSLDIWLKGPTTRVKCTCMECGNEHKRNHAETYFDSNYTHNVTPMWRKAGIFESLYESDGKLAKDVLENLKSGLAHMEANESEYLPLNPKNGWGSYKTALPWLRTLVHNFEQYPDAVIGVSA